ncbi:type II secretion system protein [Companilactobacillus insicii]|uniref:prepilin-type N-terminal cleavage/methylation domain-containing protein n=1 Tax=Companilactobacillus insicii TaxID=1732567 RepID=UPI000F776053
MLVHKSKAFTLIESIISLAIFCTLMSVSIYGLQNYQQRIEEKQVISQFKINWHNMLNYSYLNKKYTRFFYNYDTNTMTFVDLMNKKEFSHKIKLPKTLVNTKKRDVEIYVNKDGTTRPKSIEIKSTLTHKTYRYTIQMMWGELVEK